MSLSNRISLHVSWGDCDPAGIVFYPRYFEWFDRATHALLETVDLGQSVLSLKYGIVGLSLVDAKASFRGPASYGAELTVVSRIERVGTSSVTVLHVVRDTVVRDTVVRDPVVRDPVVRDPVDLAEGRETRVWTVRSKDDPVRLGSSPIPDDVRSLLLSSSASGEDEIR